MKAVRWTMLISTLLLVLVAVLFTIQNSSRLTDLSLDLGFVAFHLTEALPVPVLLWSALGVGLLGGLAAGLWLRARALRKVRSLEQELARASLGGDDGWS